MLKYIMVINLGGEILYEYIKGVFIGINKDYVIIENNGIGYKIYTSGNTISSMPPVNENVMMYIQQIVREDFIGLYGFISREELDMFNLLLTINGVGAKAALSLLSITSVNSLKSAIVSNDTKVLTKAPGVGDKTAKRIILELKDKISKNEDIKSDAQNSEINVSNLPEEALYALISLGYSEKEANNALKNVNNNDTLEGIIKNCLKFLMK